MSRFKSTKPISYGPKETFAWSFSKLRDWRSCPKKFNEVTLLKKYSEPKSIELETGDALHAAFQRRVNQGIPMPTNFVQFNDWGDDAAKIIHPLQITLCEKEIALTRDLKHTGYFDNNVWLRLKIDLVKLYPSRDGKSLAHIIDYKTGKPQDDIIQLALYAQGVFSVWPNVVGIRAEYWWTQIHDKSHEIFIREDMKELWAELLPELNKMERAQIDNIYPAKKNGLCRAHCPVWTCDFNGRKMQ
jgi:hypothetical protein